MNLKCIVEEILTFYKKSNLYNFLVESLVRLRILCKAVRKFLIPWGSSEYLGNCSKKSLLLFTLDYMWWWYGWLYFLYAKHNRYVIQHT